MSFIRKIQELKSSYDKNTSHRQLLNGLNVRNLKKMNKTSGFKTKKTVLDGIFH